MAIFSTGIIHARKKCQSDCQNGPHHTKSLPFSRGPHKSALSARLPSADPSGHMPFKKNGYHGNTISMRESPILTGSLCFFIYQGTDCTSSVCKIGPVRSISITFLRCISSQSPHIDHRFLSSLQCRRTWNKPSSHLRRPRFEKYLSKDVLFSFFCVAH